MATISTSIHKGCIFFKFQFYVHQVQTTKSFFSDLFRPAVAIRFLDFPTLIIDGELTSDGSLKFEKGKSTSFKMYSDDLRSALESKPFYVMFIDANTKNVQMLASSNVNISSLAANDNFLSEEKADVNLRRN